MNVIVADGLTKVYRTQRKQPGLGAAIRELLAPEPSYTLALDSLSLEVAPGELVGVLGPNGAGKTTLLKLLTGLLFPTEGRATVLGRVPWDREPAFKRKIAMVMGQKHQLWWDLPAMDSFLWLKEIYQVNDDDFRVRVGELADMLNITDQLTVQVRRLSLGQRMKLEIIAALLHGPSVIFLDEPTIGLDIIAQNRIRAFIREHTRSAGTTVLVTSHQMADIERLCSRVIILGGGRLMYDGSLSHLVSEHCDYKLLTVTMTEDEFDVSALGQDVGLVERDGQRYLLRVPRQRARDVAGLLWSGYDVLDLDLKDPAAADVIEWMFNTAGDGDPHGHDLSK